jgi:hypothetical protein
MMIAFADRILGFGGALDAVNQRQNRAPLPAECEDAPRVGSALLAAIKSGIIE